MSNQYTYKVPFTKEELIEDYEQRNMTQDEIAAKWGVTQKVVWHAMYKMGIKARKAFKRNQYGENNSSWKGGRVLDRKLKTRTKYKAPGYIRVKCPNHPHANKAGYVAEHIMVALDKEGIDRLPQGYCVHHINENKIDNRPENLVLCTSNMHGFYHATITPLIKPLLEMNIIGFDKDNGYFLKGGGLQ